MSPRAMLAGLFAGLAATALGGTLFVWSVGAEFAAIHARLDQHHALLEAVAILFDLTQQRGHRRRLDVAPETRP
jgi:hypothetical protein